MKSKPEYLVQSSRAPGIWPQDVLGTPDAFYKTMTEGLPPATRLVADFNRAGQLVRLNYAFNSSADPQSHFYFKRLFTPKTASVSHLDDTVGPGLQGQGVSRIVHRRLLPLYHRLGVQTANVIAVDYGPYAHAKLAFAPDAYDRKKTNDYITTLVDLVQAHPEPGVPRLPRAYANALYKWADGGDMRNFWFVTDQAHAFYGMPLGKVLTFPQEKLPAAFVRAVRDAGKYLPKAENIHWTGELDLKDTISHRRYQFYVHGATAAAKKHSVEVARSLGLGDTEIAAYMNVKPEPRRRVAAVHGLRAVKL